MRKSQANILGTTSAANCVKQVEFTDVSGLLPFNASILDSTQACVVLCIQTTLCRSVVVKAIASGQLCALNSRAATDAELKYLGDRAPVTYVELLNICPNDNQITKLNDIASVQSKRKFNNNTFLFNKRKFID